MDLYRVFLYLLSCALNETEPDEKALDNIDFKQLYSLAKKHSAVGMIGYVIGNTQALNNADADIKKKWHAEKDRPVRNNLMLDAERSAILSELEALGIWYMPLKGVILQEYYPQYGMREMCDNDILIDPNERAAVKELFKSRGYTVQKFNQGYHDAYFKNPVLCFEMHAELFSPVRYPELAARYKSVKDILIKDEENEYGYHFSNEDFYVFVLAHAHKHYSHNGTGIRTLTDIFVLQRQLGDQLDRNYVDHELSALGILDYERQSRALAEKLFGSAESFKSLQLTKAEEESLAYYLNSGSYGDNKQVMNNKLRELSEDPAGITAEAKRKYLMNRLFPSRQWCKEPHPIVYKYPVLLPFFWIWRLATEGPKKLNKFLLELKLLKKAK